MNSAPDKLDASEPNNQSQRRTMTPSTGWRFLQGRGVAQGRLFGGCLEVLDWLRGTPVWPSIASLNGAMLFIEASEEAPSPGAVARNLRSLASMGILRVLSGLLVGRPGGGVPPERFNEYDEAVLHVVTEEEGLEHLPIVTQMDFGHTDPMFVLPYGVTAQIDCDRQQFAILESAVAE